MKILKSFRPGLYDWKIGNRTLIKEALIHFLNTISEVQLKSCSILLTSMSFKTNGRGKYRIFQSTIVFLHKVCLFITKRLKETLVYF